MALSPDVAHHLHKNIDAFGWTSPLQLLRWHSTCKRHYANWLETDYLLALCERAILANERLYATSRHSAYLARGIQLHAMHLTVVFAEWVLASNTARFEAFKTTGNCAFNRRYKNARPNTLREALLKAGYVGPTGDDLTPYKSSSVKKLLSMATAYLRLRYGWELCFEKKSNDEPLYSSTIYLKIAMGELSL